MRLELALQQRHRYHGRKAQATAIFERIITGPNWMPFGFIAAEAELARIRSDKR